MPGNYGYISIDQLIDLVQMDLTYSGLFEPILLDLEIKRIVREHALVWFYKNYQFSVQRTYFFMARENMTSDVYTRYKYFIMPEEIENIVRIILASDPTLFKLGIQAPNLSINLGVTNQPFLTSFVTTVGDLAVYRSVLSSFSDEINKMNREDLKYDYNPVNKRLHILTDVPCNMVLETYARIQAEELFDLQLFKDYVTALARIRQGEALSRNILPMPGGFNFQAESMITSGKELLSKVEEKIKGECQTSWFLMSR